MLVFSEYLKVLDAAAAVIGNQAHVVSGAVSEREKSLRGGELQGGRRLQRARLPDQEGGVGKNFQPRRYR